MHRVVVLSLLTLAACGFDKSAFFGGGGGDDPDADVGSPDATEVVACQAWQTELFTPCDLPEPEGDVTVSGNAGYDTDDGTLVVDGTPVPHATTVIADRDPQVRVISAAGFAVELGAELRVQGSLPLLIAASDQISVLGTIDVSSSSDGGLGAGANPPACEAEAISAKPGLPNSGGGGGGGGGGFGADGGDGGQGDTDNAGARGKQAPSPPGIRGGCPGARGGNGAVGDGGDGGAGGGAVVLASATSVTVGGRLIAGGAGGRGATPDDAGGGGGGSGGLLGFDAPEVRWTNGAVIAANGGSGAEGSNNSTTGQDGDPGRADALAAGGGGAGGAGGNGGDGGALVTPGGSTGDTNGEGGGGGGGGVGVIILFSGDLDAAGLAVVSPNVTQP